MSGDRSQSSTSVSSGTQPSTSVSSGTQPSTSVSSGTHTEFSTQKTRDGMITRLAAVVGTGSLTAGLPLSNYIKEFVNASQTLAPNVPEANMTLFIIAFVIGGSLGYGIVSFILKYLSGKRKVEVEIEFNKKIDQTWRKDIRPAFVRIYSNLGNELRKVYKKYFGLEDSSLPESEHELRNYVSQYILPSEDVYKCTPIIERDSWKRL